MRIGCARLENQGATTRTVATITWEDCDRPPFDVFFETEAPFAGALPSDADPFLAAAVLPAMRFGERRVFVEAGYCPYLKAGLEVNMALVRSWHGRKRPPVIIEGRPRTYTRGPHRNRRTGFFMSGGIDSLSVLRRNRLTCPPGHPAAIRDGILIFGLEITDPAAFAHVRSAVNAIASAADVVPIPVATNVRYLVDDWKYWHEEFAAAVLASVALALSPRLSLVHLPSAVDFALVHNRMGSHPLLDPNFSSYDLRIQHDAALTRLEKTRLVADWPPALQGLRVCNSCELYRPGILNCGRCEKCLRTLTALLILGKLDEATTFAKREISAERLSSISLKPTDYAFWLEMLQPLADRGRLDLVRAIHGRIKAMRGAAATGWWRTLRNFDQRYLRGTVAGLKRVAEGWTDSPPVVR